jgi:tetratricopeptide (TPR) repeat protein
MEAPPVKAVRASVEVELRRIRQLLEGNQFAGAVAAAQALAADAPEHRDVLYVLAVGFRHLGRIPEALSTLAQLERHHPNYPRLHQERGHCYVAVRSAEKAIKAFLTAVTLNPSLPGSWTALQALYKLTGQQAYAEDAARHVANLAALPPAIVTAFSMYADGEVHDAERVVRQYLLTHGNHIEGMRLLAQIGVTMDALDDAELLLESVLVLAPEYHAARYEYALVLLKRHNHVRAQQEIERLLETDPQNRVYRTTLAAVLTGFGNVERGLPVYRSLLAETPNDPELHLSIAHTLKTLGRTSEAVDSYRTAAAARPHYGEAYWSLANLKTYRFTDAEISRMQSDEAAQGVPSVDRYHLCFALGKAMEDRHRFEESFRYYERGNALKKIEQRYEPSPFDRNARLQAEVCTREFFEARRGYGCRSTAPIFIVGLPRAGSTLLEQILASHSQVEGTMELANILRLVQQLKGRESTVSNPTYPAILRDLNAEACERFGRQYLDETRVYRSGTPFFIDKMPNNFRHIGLIHLILPDAKIIDARREAVACCFSNFKQLFASGQKFTYGIEDIARYYRMYVELMAHWDAALPGKVLRVNHEDVVEDLEGNVHRILDFCELEFEPQCVDFHRTARRVHTASSEQVRRPINREGIDQWRHFEPWLGPLRAALSSDAAG